MEMEEDKLKQQTTNVTYKIGTNYSDFPVFLLIICWLSNIKNNGWLGIFSIGLLILQHLCVMLGPSSTGIVILNPLKVSRITNLFTYVHL